MSKGKLFTINIIGILVVLALVIGGVYYYNQSANYVKTDDAKISGDMVQIASPVSGKLTSWDAKEGTKFSEDETTGKVDSPEAKSSVSIKTPIEGTVIKDEAKEGQLVQAGQPLAQVVDMKKLFVVANIDETDIRDVEVGADVDVTVDENSDTTLKGKVEQIGYATNSVFSLLPQQNTSGDYTKVTQKIPVKISISNYSEDVLPGMNAEVKISK
ncbi:HlyD family efflux transporter periplasmic adaptor subunit [Fictibacillus sp. Mic-4]|uniref:efflux RND transporter periplasmic adaptor subunit n=1 Tax=Fictibacillus TaxID=1329200 RepID=UPI0004288C02|nr:HlyD family efflux transporter periplasmic adaptor subunit [Fictibacillus gelatini]